MTNLNNSETVVNNLKSAVIPQVKLCLNKRFESFESDIFQNMMWVDPANWGDTAGEIESLLYLADHFEGSLAANNFDRQEVPSEWPEFKRRVNYCMKGVTGLAMWERIFLFRRSEFINVCLLAEIVLCLGVSNSIVESGFSHLTHMLTDRRLSLKHKTMENLLLIKINDFVWSEGEKDEILEKALDTYMTGKRRKRVVDVPSNSTSQSKHMRGNADSQIIVGEENEEQGANNINEANVQSDNQGADESDSESEDDADLVLYEQFIAGPEDHDDDENAEISD